MSYILDALKKVEHEKARKAGSGGITSISGDLFRERTARSFRSGTWKIVTALVVVSTAILAVAWFVLKTNKIKRDVPASQPLVTAVTTPAVVPIPPVSVPPAQISPLTNSGPAMERGARSGKKPAGTAALQPAPQKTVVQTIPAPADIKVSGIAWQEERAARRAVVNDFLLREGTTVSGAKIVEIHQDRVRFSSPAGLFDVRMDSANTPGMAR